jgi:pimeloyl-ACP methyl ester carboxylesterase
MKRSSVRLIASALAVVALAFVAPAAEAQPSSNRNAVIFVHGFVGSGAQFESQEMRFTSNGYPSGHIAALEYDSTFGTESREQVHRRLDALIAIMKQRTGRPKVDILGHSLGTSVMQDYLNSSPARAAKVAHYVNIDGREADAPPGGVPTLAIWAGRGEPGRRIEGAQNVTVPNQTHVQSATSAESFVHMFKFFTGSAPSTKHIVRQLGRISIAGKVLLFPQNRGLEGATLRIWELDAASGQRKSSSPVASVVIGANGRWGPLPIEAGKRYEFATSRVGFPPHHYYYEPFVRSDHLIRLLESDALAALVDKSDNHTGMVIIRYKELWGDQGTQNDSLRINGTNVCNAAICPIEQQVNAVFAFDRGSDGRTDLSAPDPVFFSLPFITGADIFIPADIPPTGRVSVALTSRGGGPVRTLNFPNFASSQHRVTVQLRDFEHVGPAPSGGG